jgi:hypothetical protein
MKALDNWAWRESSSKKEDGLSSLLKVHKGYESQICFWVLDFLFIELLSPVSLLLSLYRLLASCKIFILSSISSVFCWSDEFRKAGRTGHHGPGVWFLNINYYRLSSTQKCCCEYTLYPKCNPPPTKKKKKAKHAKVSRGQMISWERPRRRLQWGWNYSARSNYFRDP